VIGVYVPGCSLVHRAPAGLKLLLLLLVGAASALLVSRPWQVGAALLVVVVFYRLAELGWRAPIDQLRPLLWLLACVAVFHALASGWADAVVVIGTIVVLVLLAGLVTLTTRTSALVDVVVSVARPLRRLGAEPERLRLLLALGIRSVPVVVGLAVEVRDAQHARGLTGDPRAFAVPLVVRSLRHADALSEALAARGLDD
jgi:biotin transport system permease protein